MGVVQYPGLEEYINADPKHKAAFKAYSDDLLRHANVEQLKEWYEWYSSGTSNEEIPEYNIPDWDNDTIDVLRAKVMAITDADWD